MLSLENIISDIVPNVSNKQEKFGVNPYSGYDFVWKYGWSVLESIPKCLHKSPYTYWILKNDLIL